MHEILNREQILRPRTVETVPVQTREGTLLIRGLTGAEGARFDAAFDATRPGKVGKDGAAGPPIKAVLFCMSVCDERGVLLFGEEEARRVARDVPLALIQAVYARAVDLNGYGIEAQETDAKNSAGPSGNGSDLNLPSSGDVDVPSSLHG